MCYYMYLLVQSKSFFANKQTPYFLKKKKTLFKTKKHPSKVKTSLLKTEVSAQKNLPTRSRQAHQL